MADRSGTSTGFSVYAYGGLHKVLTLSATVLLAKTNSVMFLQMCRPIGTLQRAPQQKAQGTKKIAVGCLGLFRTVVNVYQLGLKLFELSL